MLKMNSIIHLLLARVGHTTVFDTNSAEQPNLALTVVQQLGINLVAPSLIAKEPVHLIKRASLSLGDKKGNIQRAEGAHYAKENVHAVRCSSDETRCGHSDGKVVEPVSRCTDRDTLCAQAEWKYFGDDDPRARAPRKAEANGEYPDEGNSGPARSAVCGPVVLALCDDACDDKFAEAHDDCADDERWFATPLVDVKHSRNGREEHDDTDDTRSK